MCKRKLVRSYVKAAEKVGGSDFIGLACDGLAAVAMKMRGLHPLKREDMLLLLTEGQEHLYAMAESVGIQIHEVNSEWVWTRHRCGRLDGGVEVVACKCSKHCTHESAATGDSTAP
jgi:hypothetical protein